MAEEKREGFSYESPEKQKRSAIKLFVIEIAVLMIVVVGILITLIYMGVIKLPFVVEEKQEVVDTRGYRDGTLPITPTIIPVEAELIVRSDNPDYELTISEANKEKVINIIKNWPVYGRQYNLNNKVSTVDTVEIILDANPSNIGVVRDGDQIASSAKSEMKDNVLRYYIYFSNNKLSELGVNAGDTVLGSALFTINRTIYNYSTQGEILAADRGLQDLYRKEEIIGNNIFQLDRK